MRTALLSLAKFQAFCLSGENISLKTLQNTTGRATALPGGETAGFKIMPRVFNKEGRKAEVSLMGKEDTGGGRGGREAGPRGC